MSKTYKKNWKNTGKLIPFQNKVNNSMDPKVQRRPNKPKKETKRRIE